MKTLKLSFFLIIFLFATILQAQETTNKDEIMVEGSSVDVWNFPIVSGVSVKVLNVTDILDTAVSSLNEAETWLVGDPDSPLQFMIMA